MVRPINDRDLAELSAAVGNTAAAEIFAARGDEPSDDTQRCDDVAARLAEVLADPKASKATKALATEINKIIGVEE